MGLLYDNGTYNFKLDSSFIPSSPKEKNNRLLKLTIQKRLTYTCVNKVRKGEIIMLRKILKALLGSGSSNHNHRKHYSSSSRKRYSNRDRHYGHNHYKKSHKKSSFSSRSFFSS